MNTLNNDHCLICFVVLFAWPVYAEIKTALWGKLVLKTKESSISWLNLDISKHILIQLCLFLILRIFKYNQLPPSVILPLCSVLFSGQLDMFIYYWRSVYGDCISGCCCFQWSACVFLPKPPPGGNGKRPEAHGWADQGPARVAWFSWQPFSSGRPNPEGHGEYHRMVNVALYVWNNLSSFLADNWSVSITISAWLGTSLPGYYTSYRCKKSPPTVHTACFFLPRVWFVNALCVTVWYQTHPRCNERGRTWNHDVVSVWGAQ